ncbi:MAG: hypothetical protein R3C28_29780 [Pirellulaceae bacterium]
MHRRSPCKLSWVWLAVCVLFAQAVFVVAQEDEANEDLIAMVIDFMSDTDKDIRSLAFEQIRTKAKGEAATKRFAEQLDKLPVDGQIGLLSALADRADSAAKPAVDALLETAQGISLTVAAIEAVGRLGDETDVAKLVSFLKGSNADITAAARGALVRLPGEQTPQNILQACAAADAKTQVQLIEILAERRSLDTIPQLLQMAIDNDASVRSAAMTALGELASSEHVAGMAQGVLKAAKGKEQAAAEKNLMFVCERMDDVDQRAIPLLDAMKKMKTDDRLAMMSTLGRIGGKPALTEVEKAIASRNGAEHSAGIRAISNWPDASVSERLIQLAKSDKHDSHRRTLRMALIRMAPLPDGRTDEQKLTLLKTAYKLAADDKERNYAIQRAAAIRLPETLRFVVPFLKNSKLQNEACQTIVQLAHDRKLRDDNKPEFHAALDQVLTLTKDPVLIDRANRYKKGQTWVRPK